MSPTDILDYSPNKRCLARVVKGAAWLDGVMPNWHRKIKPKRLELSSGADCVLGQLAPAFVRICPIVRAEIKATAREYGQSFAEAAREAEYGTVVGALRDQMPELRNPERLGFLFEDSTRDRYGWKSKGPAVVRREGYVALNAAWTAEIRKRLATDRGVSPEEGTS